MVYFWIEIPVYFWGEINTKRSWKNLTTSETA